MNLFIVESPHKAQTIKGFLGKDKVEWKIIATKGHIRDLPVKEYGVKKVGNEYVGEEVFISDEKRKITKEIEDLSKNAQVVYIATDNDREGEKICEDIVEFAKIKRYKRIVYSEITESAIREAIDSAREVDDRVVNAQKTRRIIDRLGYKLSQIITYSFKAENNKHAPTDNSLIGVGRVSLAALKLIVENGRIRKAFSPEEKMQISVAYETPSGEQFQLVHPMQFAATQKVELEDMTNVLKSSTHIVSKFDVKRSYVSPRPPLSVAFMLRSSFYAFGFYPERTMVLAQDLYDAGLITYHRTEGTNLAQSAIESIILTLGTYYTEDDIAFDGRIVS